MLSGVNGSGLHLDMGPKFQTQIWLTGLKVRPTPRKLATYIFSCVMIANVRDIRFIIGFLEIGKGLITI